MSDFEAGVIVGVLVGTCASIISYAVATCVMRRVFGVERFWGVTR